ncbi:YeeE/YedE family protein [Rhodospirillaceae bacterium KN72]|uniref:YeeE/YedE family protein n=1 Tax=Pacificispira spongiicola TaxID=2729598 RepID=A0A7Y0HH20_9PROT|nr:YeeE/YedE family protein [Pacificispira spongiicola]NMM46253.1 YeeE/YedE family protein [Pacificispira spongiicola]
MESLLASNEVSDLTKAGLGGIVVGVLFGYCAVRSRFCLRSACIEFWRLQPGRQFAVWLLTFGAALFLTQLLFRSGHLSATEVRQLSTAGTLSGAVIGGVMFGIGMILARGCASRLLVLSGTGNMRALVAGLIVTVVAQASLTGILSPLRLWLSGLSVLSPSERDLTMIFSPNAGVIAGAAIVAVALVISRRQKIGGVMALTGILVGGSVALGWAFTAALARVSFDPVPVGSVSFTGPSADTLMALIATPSIVPSFSIGLVPGVFVGAWIAAVTTGEFRIQAFDRETGMVRYLIGAPLMGFGGMLAGGCAVGAGVTGGAVLSLTAWIALFAMWIGAGIAIFLFDRQSA